MKNRLTEYRHQHKTAKQIYAAVIRLKNNEQQRRRMGTRIVVTRDRLLKEMNRVQWLLWPANGLPGNAGKIK